VVESLVRSSNGILSLRFTTLQDDRNWWWQMQSGIHSPSGTMEPSRVCMVTGFYRSFLSLQNDKVCDLYLDVCLLFRL